MVVVLLIGGIVFVLAGALAVLFGLPVKEFSFGNTLLLIGAIFASTGAIMFALWIVVRELKKIVGQLGLQPVESRAAAAAAPPNFGAALGNQAPEDGGFPFSGDQPSADQPGHAVSAPWQDETASRGRGEAPPAPEPVEPPAKPRRNLLFSSSSRKERERLEARASDSPAVGAPPPVGPAEAPPPASFEDAWPKSERARSAEIPPPRRTGRAAPSTFTEPGAAAPVPERQPPAERSDVQPQVTVLKSGVVDGMAYSLYSDGSIEAQMPEGMMRFASIDELRAHLDHRP